ncbi:MAG: energy transducer TonB [Lutibacter sp.]|nr:energy transducer TonB [Lutibacter sp.]MBP9599924.1 energy transducer TonB [Lutibacter sp.]
MEIKKYPHAILENYSKIFIQLGLVLSLFIVYESFQMKSYPSEVKAVMSTFVSVDNQESIIEIKPVEVQQTETPKAVITERILKVDDAVEIEETILESTEISENDAVVVKLKKELVVVEKEEEPIVEDVPFMIIEDVPLYPGCKGTNEERRACFSEEITKFVARNFNTQLSTDLGLTPGTIQKIFVMFKINKEGEISEIKARAPHVRLQEEAIRVIQKLPKMTPGKQRGKAVSVSYGLPIMFKVE